MFLQYDSDSETESNSENRFLMFYTYENLEKLFNSRAQNVYQLVLSFRFVEVYWKSKKKINGRTKLWWFNWPNSLPSQRSLYKRNQELIEVIVGNYNNYRKQGNVLTYLLAISCRLKLYAEVQEECGHY